MPSNLRLITPVIASVVSAGALIFCSPAVNADEVVELIDQTKIIGKIVHYYDGVLTLQLPNGSKMKLPDNKIKQLHFKLPKPRAELSTPQKSFNRLKSSALKGDLATYIDTHSAYYQIFLSHQVESDSPQKFSQQLKQEWASVDLDIVDTKIDNNVAIMKVKRRKGTESGEGEFRFVKENNEWKMILPL